MNELMGSKSDYAISSWLYENEPIEKVINKISKFGFNQVELWADQVHADPRLKNLSNIKRALFDSKMTVHSIHAPFSIVGNDFPDPLFFKKWKDLLIRTAQISGEVGSGLMVVHILDRRSYNVYESHIGRIYDFIAEISDECRIYGVKILLENLIGSGTPGEFNCTISELKRTFDSLDIGYCIDISHSLLTNRSIEDEIQLAGNKLLSVHVSSNDGLKDIHSLPDRGVIKWEELRKVFRQKGYQGNFVLEINGMECPDKIMKGIDKCFIV